ncbi:MAG TPA: hypothetical protein VD969_17785 [Symbiobacteriaceae bacterium]|nr:hypothetical protein [Symbiobacteriaceae bacterium]
MLDRLLGRRVTVTVRILGQVGGRMVRWDGQVRLREPASVGAVLARAGKAAGADLLGALQQGDQPALLLNGRRLDLPSGLSNPVPDGALISWLMPMAGG